jgi:NAD(P)-dependent dehydrogenase (short-subunit alcohol dehydrogenase family)
MDETNEKNCVITGANSGLGYWTTVSLAEKGYRIFMLCRSVENGIKAQKEISARTKNQKLEVIQVDLSALTSIEKCVHEIRQRTKHVDVLINNAALVSSKRIITAEGFELQFAVNYLAAFYLTHLLIPLLRLSPGARIVNISSNNHRKGRIHFNDLFFERKYHILKAYNQSKLANVLFSYELERRRKEAGLRLSVFCVDPGHNNTRIGLKKTTRLHSIAWFIRKWMGHSPEKGAICQVFVATNEAIQKLSGNYWRNCRQVPSSPDSYNEIVSQKLWNFSLKLCKIKNYLSD